MIHNKLVRDKIPQIISQCGHSPIIHIADGDEYYQMLINKLIEEATEFSKSNTPDELADVLEVIHALCKYHDFCIDDIEQLRIDKRKSRGGFEDKIILDKVHTTRSAVEGILLERLI